MSQALRLLESEHRELQTTLESLQGDREQQSSETQDLQGTHPLPGHRVMRITANRLRGRRLWGEALVLIRAWFYDFFFP